MARHTQSSGLAGTLLAAVVVVVGEAEEAAVASIDRASAGASGGSARPAWAAVEGALGLAEAVLETLMHSRRRELSAAILLGVAGPAAVLAVRAHCVAAAVIARAVLWRRHLAGLLRSRTESISAP